MIFQKEAFEAGSDKAGGEKTGLARQPGLVSTCETPKTMFIIVQAGLAIWNILRTDVFKILRAQPNLRIVIFSPLVDEEFKREVAGENIIVEPLPQWRGGPIVRTLRSFRKDVWSQKAETVRFREKRASRKNQFARGLLYGLLFRGGRVDRVDRAWQKLSNWEARLTPPLASEYFEKYRPDLVFYTTIYAKDLALEIGAKQRGVKSVAFILSWDNPTTKGPFLVKPDRAILWNNIMRDELLKFHEFSPEHLFVSGPPQFDIYADATPYASREEFFAKWKLDPNKKLITYTTGSQGMLPFEHETVELIYGQIQAGVLRQDCQLLVRHHPKDLYEFYKKFEGKPGLTLQRPGRRGLTDDSWNPSLQDMYGLAETMRYSDVIVNIASTITIDAAAFNTPVVNVAWDGFSNPPYERSCRRYYDFDHYKRIVEAKGTRIAHTLQSTMECIQQYLDNPTLDSEGRARIRDEQCYRLDGKAGERIAHYLLQLLNSNSA